MSDWAEKTLGDLVQLQRGYDLPAQDREDGTVPVMGGGGQNGFHSEHRVKGPGVVIGRSGAGFGNAFYCDQDFWAHNTALFVKDFNGNDVRYVFHFLDNFDFEKYNSGGAQPSLNRNFIYPIKIKIPPIEEQKFIANAADTWDRAIEVTESLITAKQQQFEWLTTRLINQSGGKKTPLSDFVTEVSTRNRGGQIERVLSVTNRNGFVLPEDQFERRVASADVSNYKVVERGQYAYNPSRINVGSIARLDDWDNGILSPMYTVFKLDSKKIDSDYFLHWLSSTEAKQRIRNSAQGSVRETVSFGDLGSIPMALPSIPEQKSIAHTLNTAQGEIKLLQALAEKYRTQKRGLMQKLLSGQWRLNDKKEAA